MLSRRRFSRIAAGAGVAIAAPALSRSSRAQGQPIKIGTSISLTGPLSATKNALVGYQLWRDDINAAGGLLGRPVLLVERDDQARNELGAQIARELVGKEKIVAGVGIVNTGVALASQRFYQEARIPMITAVATGSIVTRQFLPPQHPDNFIFRVSANDTIQAAPCH